MRSMKEPRALPAVAAAAAVIAGIALISTACAKRPDWAAKNEKLIAAQSLTVRTRDDIPAARINPSLQDGVVKPIGSVPETLLAPGVKAKLYWGKGNLVAWLTFEPNAEIGEEVL